MVYQISEYWIVHTYNREFLVFFPSKFISWSWYDIHDPSRQINGVALFGKSNNGVATFGNFLRAYTFYVKIQPFQFFKGKNLNLEPLGKYTNVHKTVEMGLLSHGHWGRLKSSDGQVAAASFQAKSNL